MLVLPWVEEDEAADRAFDEWGGGWHAEVVRGTTWTNLAEHHSWKLVQSGGAFRVHFSYGFLAYSFFKFNGYVEVVHYNL